MNVLITSISRKVPMVESLRRALGRVAPGALLWGGDSDSRAVARWFVDAFWEMPQLGNLGLDDLLHFCNRNDVGWIVPSRDGELEPFALWGNELANRGVRVMISPPSTVQACVDKLQFFERLQTMPEVVPTLSVPDKPGVSHWVVKERFGAGSRRLVLNASSEEARHEARDLLSPVFQPFVEGIEYSVDLYRSRAGEVWGCVVRSRDRVVAGESQVTTVARHPSLEDVCRRAAGQLGITGHAVFQAIEDPRGRLHLFECNCRFGGASTLSVAAGLESFEWFLRETTDDGFRPREFVRGTPGLRLVRYPTDRIIEPGAGI